MTDKPRCNGTMTESQYLSWIRSALRSKSLLWPPRAKALELARRPYKGDNKTQKWQYQCAICQEWFKAKEVVVDHHPKAAGSILKWQDIGAFCNNLYCETDNLRVLCSNDHDIHTLAEKMDISFEEARFEKLLISTFKDKQKVLQILKEHDIIAKNDTQRKEALRSILRKEMEDE